MSFEIRSAQPGEADAFLARHDRDWRSELWDFRVVWHEETHDILALDGDAVAGVLRLRIAASLGHVEALYVLPERRRHGIGRDLVARAEAVANWYNCHKMTVAVFREHAAQAFFLACGYTVEAIVPQHTFKLDVALLRKFLL